MSHSHIVIVAVLMVVGPLTSRSLAFDSRLSPSEYRIDQPVYAEAWALDAYTQDPSTSRGLEPSPFLAGLMSVLVPGMGQLTQGQARGWAYLGLDVMSWFALVSFHAAGDQGLVDSRKVADAHWTEERYLGTPQGCQDSQGNSVGPGDLEEEHEQLQKNFANNRGRYYDDLSRNQYACGWDDMLIRDQYTQSRKDAQSLHTKADWTVALMVVNRLVSAIDAGRTAAGRRNEKNGLDLQSRWRGGDPEVRLAYRIGF